MSPGRYRVALVAIFAVYAALYLRTAGYEAVWDDLPAIFDNPLYEGPWTEGIGASQHDHLDPALRKLSAMRVAHDSYRPLLYLSHRLERELYGKSAAAHHLHNVVVGALALTLVLLLARRWLAHDGKALAVAAVFALHPLQVESIAYISARGDLLAALFAAASLWLSLRGDDQGARRWPWVLASTACLVLSMLSKEAYVGVPIALALIGWSMGRTHRHIVDIGAHAVGLALYLVLRSSMTSMASGQAGASAIVILPGLWLQYFSIFLAPIDLSIVRPLTEIWLVPGWLALAPVLFGLWLTSRGELDGQRLIARQAIAGALVALVFIGPSAIVAKIMGVVADRYACLPLSGYAVAVISAGHWLRCVAPASARPMNIIGAGLAAAWLVASALQVPVWQNPKSLYANAYAVEPASSAAAYGLGYAHAQDGDWSAARPLFARAVELDPKNSRAWNNLSVAALNQGDYDGAIAAAKGAIAVSKAPFRALFNLATAHLHRGQSREGCAALARAIQINPNYAEARRLMAHACPAPEARNIP